jgi:hypothetical protein
MVSKMFSINPTTAHPEIWQAQVPAQWEKGVKALIPFGSSGTWS